MTMPEFRKRPIKVEARQWLPGDPFAAGQLIGWINDSGGKSRIVAGLGASCVLEVTTISGDPARVRGGDWVIAESVPGRFYPCDAAEFERTYGPASEPDEAVLLLAELDGYFRVAEMSAANGLLPPWDGVNYRNLRTKVRVAVERAIAQAT